MIEIFQMVQSVFTIDWVVQQLTANDFLVAGIAAALAYLLRSIPRRIWSFVNRQMSIEFTLTNEDDDYEDLVKFLESRRIRWFSRTYTKKLKDWEHETDSNELTIGYGASWFIYNGTLGKITREFKESNHANKLKEEIFIKLFTRRSVVLMNIIKDAVKHKTSDNNSISVYLPESSYWIMNSKITKRTFDTVFIEDHIKQQIKDSLDKFCSSKDWYISKGIPYKFGIFIEGPAGTGKSSIVKAISSYLNRNMYFMSSSGMQESNLPSLVGELSRDKNSILVLEEIDTLSTDTSDRDNEDGKKRVNMSVILNTMDGALTPDNFIFIATTNHYDRIDSAIKRPGRFDLVIRIDNMSFDVFVNMVSSLYEVPKNIVVEDFSAKYVPITGSVVQGTFILERDYTKAKEILFSKMT